MIEAAKRAGEVKDLLNSGRITYDEATEMVEPHLAGMNDRMKQIAKKFGRKHYPIGIRKFLRQ